MNRFLGWALAAWLAVLAAPVQAQVDAVIADYNRLLKKYARPEGVRYDAWTRHASDRALLDSVLARMGGIATTGWPADKRLAFCLDLYNATLLREVLNKYPGNKRVTGNPFFFWFDSVTLSGEEMNLDDLETRIREGSQDPRVCFALFRGCVSSPPLASQAYSGRKLDKALDETAHRFVNSPDGVVYRPASRSVELSAVFEWYEPEFGGKGGMINFVNRYLKNAVPQDARIDFMGFDWRTEPEQ